MSEIVFVVYMLGFAVMLGYEWQLGPHSADMTDNPWIGWFCAVMWPVVIPVRVLLWRMSQRAAVNKCEPVQKA